MNTTASKTFYAVIRSEHNAEDWYSNRNFGTSYDTLQSEDKVSEYFTTQEEAEAVLNTIADAYTVKDSSVLVEFSVVEYTAEIDEDGELDLDEQDYDFVGDSIIKEYQYKSLKGAILVSWNWQRYVGYAREFEGIRFGEDGEDERLLLKQDRCYRSQVDVVLTAEEMANMSKDEISLYLEKALLSESWKWTNRNAVISAIEDENI